MNFEAKFFFLFRNLVWNKNDSVLSQQKNSQGLINKTQNFVKQIPTKMVLIKCLCKVPQTKTIGLQFCQNWWWNQKSGWEQCTGNKEGDPPTSGEFHLQFLHLYYLLHLGCYFYYYSSVNLRARIKSYKTQFQTVLNFTHFPDTLKLGMKQGLQGQT